MSYHSGPLFRGVFILRLTVRTLGIIPKRPQRRHRIVLDLAQPCRPLDLFEDHRHPVVETGHRQIGLVMRWKLETVIEAGLMFTLLRFGPHNPYVQVPRS